MPPEGPQESLVFLTTHPYIWLCDRQFGIIETPENSHKLHSIVDDTWNSLRDDQRLPFHERAQQESQRYLAQKKVYDDVYVQYFHLKEMFMNKSSTLQATTFTSNTAPSLKPMINLISQQLSKEKGPSETAAEPARTHFLQASHLASQNKSATFVRKGLDPLYLQSVIQGNIENKRKALAPPVSVAAPPLKKPAFEAEAGRFDKLEIICGQIRGTLHLAANQVVCKCKVCEGKLPGQRVFTCSRFESHAGFGHSKKWKHSFKILPGSHPAVPKDSDLSVARFFEVTNYDYCRIRPPLRLPTSNQKRQEEKGDEDDTHDGSDEWYVQYGTKGRVSQRVPSLRSERSGRVSQEAALVPRPIKGDRASAQLESVKQQDQQVSWLDMESKKHSPVYVSYSSEKCAACDDDGDFDYDQLITCDKCGISVHQSCYGILEPPDHTKPWLCCSCEAQGEGCHAPQCCLCPVVGGALKPSVIPGVWVHSTCAQWIPEVTVKGGRTMDDVDGILEIPKERWELFCGICKQRVGAKIQCECCYSAFHPLCARLAGFAMVTTELPNGDLLYRAYCSRHRKGGAGEGGVGMKKADRCVALYRELPEEMPGQELDNAQPYRSPGLMEVPKSGNNSARATKIEGWKRTVHSTGIGTITDEAFWLPTMAEKRSKDAGCLPASEPELVHNLSTLSAQNRALKPLLALPPGVPEEVPIWCNGHEAWLIVRTQRVLSQRGAATHSASRWEAMCGKAESKKWKTSFFVLENGSKKVLQEWLAEKRLTADVLSALSKNYIENLGCGDMRAKAAVQVGKEDVQSLTGYFIRIYWPEDAEWYEATAVEENPKTRQHLIKYFDGDEEWIDLGAEMTSGRVQKLTRFESDRESWPQVPPVPPVPLPANEQPIGIHACGRRVGLWDATDECYYYGSIQKYNDEMKLYKVVFEEGGTKWLALEPGQHPMDWSSAPLPAQHVLVSSDAEDGDKEAGPLTQVPDRLAIYCRDLKGTFLVKEMMCMLPNGTVVTPSEFERLGGRMLAKKWKTSLRVDTGHSAGMTLEAWLSRFGGDTNKHPSKRWEVGRLRDQQRAHTGALRLPHQKNSGAVGPKLAGHKPGCNCVICRQKRSRGDLQNAVEKIVVKRQDEQMTGKRAFIKAVPYTITVGAQPSNPATIPLSRCWMPKDWIAYKAAQALTEKPMNKYKTKFREGPGVDDGARRGHAVVVLSGDGGLDVQREQFSTGFCCREAVPLSLKDKMTAAKMTERHRITFGKSGIHGWGLFAKTAISQDSLVAEFRGIQIRKSVADRREADYRMRASDCYLFNVDDDIVLDGTMTGSIARFTNHSCSPSLYARLLNVGSECRLAFFARYDIAARQELTYNYRFLAEEGDDRLSCACGAPNCTGFLN